MTSVHQPRSLALDQGAEEDQASTRTRWTPAVLSRIAGAAALLVFVGNQIYYGFVAPDLGPPEPTVHQMVTWLAAHQQQLLFQFVIGYVAIVFAGLIALLVTLCRGRGMLATLANLGAGANLAIALTYFGLYFGVWTLSKAGGSHGGLVAVLHAAESYAHAQLMAVGLSVLAVSVLALRTRTLPRWLAWLGILMGAEHILTYLVFAASPDYSTTLNGPGGAGGIFRVLDIVLEYLWLLVTGIVLLVKPVRLPTAPSEQEAATP